MKPIAEMAQIEIAAYVQSWLEKQGIRVILSGGAATSFFSLNRYVSGDIDLVNVNSVRRDRIRSALKEIGFAEVGRHFKHPDSQFIVEFPPGPLTVGVEPVKQVERVELSSGILYVISATDCVKDRLAAFFHWHDEQCLYQAILIRDSADIDLNEIERWSKGEGKEEEFEIFLANKVQ
jgi:hypothetical protein